MSPLRALLKKELLDTFRDRRTLIVMILLPVLLYPGLLLLMGTVMLAGKERLAREHLTIAATTEDAMAILSSQPLPPNTAYTRLERADAEQRLKDKKLWAIVEAPIGSSQALAARGQVTVTVDYTKRHDRSVEALDRLRRVLKAAGVHTLSERLTEAGLPKDFAEPLRLQERDVDFERDLGPLMASRLLPLILVVMLFMGALYPAVDLTAGEKERGTLETLLVSPVPPMQVMAAKYLTVALIATIATFANLAAMTTAFSLGLSVDPSVKMTLSLKAQQVLILAIALVPTIFLVTGLALAVSSLAKSFKEGQNLLTPLVLLGTAPGIVAQIPGVELTTLTAWVPLLNVSLLIKATILGAAHASHVAITFVSVAICSLGALKLAANAFQSEALRFGGTDAWRELFRSSR